jgi:hypothetical protein
MDKKQELKSLIKNSDLEKADKEKWEMIINSLPENAIEAFLEIFQKFPKEIGWFNENYKKKEKASALLEENREVGQKMLSEIYKEEAEKMQSLMKAQ